MFIITLSIALQLLWQIANAEARLSPPRPGNSEITSEFSYFSSKANYLSGGGQAKDLPPGASFSSMQLNGIYAYDWRADWRFWGGVNLSSVTTDNGTEERTNSGLNEVLLGAQNWYDLAQFEIVPEARLAFPFFSVDENKDNALFGEGAAQLRTGAYAFWPLEAWRPYIYLGFEYRNDGRSSLLPYAIGTKYSANRWWFLGEYRGFESVIDDADKNNQDHRNRYLQSVNGGSYRYYSVNPSLSELGIEIGHDFGGVKIHGGAALTVNGANSAEGWTVLVGAAYEISSSEHTKSVDTTTQDSSRFRVQEDHYDESLFKEKSTAKPKPRKKNIDKLIKETERSLEQSP